MSHWLRAIDESDALEAGGKREAYKEEERPWRVAFTADTSKWNPSLRAMARRILDETVLDSM